MITIRDYKKTAIITPQSEISYTELMQHILQYGTRLTADSGFKAVVLSENREEWIYAFFAIWQKKGIAVPVDATSTAADVAYILNDCRPDYIFVSEGMRKLAEEAISKAGVEIKVLPIEISAYSNEAPETTELTFTSADSGQNIALIIYTSGTTGSPKGVMLSYDNLEANIRGVADEVPIFNGERRTLILLPLHHVLPLMGTVIAPITRGCGVAICPSLSGPDIMAMLERGQIAIMVGVPRLWQTLYQGIMKKIDASPVARTLFNICKKVQNRRLSRTVFSAVHKKMGGHLDYCVCGGAALDREIGDGLKALGLEVLEGYGMTEMAPIIAFTRPGDYIPGCAGLPLPSVECKIVDGELLCKGKNLMMGYYNRPEETAEVIDKDGFLHTGDLAELDEKGRVYITGRSKEIIVLSNGKNVQPNEIEYKLEKYAAQVKEAAVTQDGDLLRAIIVPQEQWLGSKTDAEAEDALKREVLEPYNLTVANYKKLMSVKVYRGDLPRTKLEKLQRFTETGGCMLITCDYSDPVGDMPNYSSLLRSYGFLPREGIVVAEAEDSSHYYNNIRIDLIPEMLSTDVTMDLVASGANTVLMPGSRAFETPGETDRNLMVFPVLQSGEKAYLKQLSPDMTSIEKAAEDPSGPFTLALQAQRVTAGGYVSRAFLCGSSGMMTEEQIYAMTDAQQLILRMTEHLTGQSGSNLEIMGKSAVRPALSARGNGMGSVIVTVMPLAVLMAAAIVLLRRKNR